jgi:hypothetical protein
MIKYLVMLLLLLSCSKTPKYQSGDCVLFDDVFIIRILEVTEDKYTVCALPDCEIRVSVPQKKIEDISERFYSWNCK